MKKLLFTFGMFLGIATFSFAHNASAASIDFDDHYSKHDAFITSSFDTSINLDDGQYRDTDDRYSHFNDDKFDDLLVHVSDHDDANSWRDHHDWDGHDPHRSPSDPSPVLATPLPPSWVLLMTAFAVLSLIGYFTNKKAGS